MKKLLLGIPVLIDNEKRLTGCIESARKQTLVKNGECDICVIINNKDDESLIGQIDAFDDIDAIVNDVNLGVSGSWNQAILEAGGGGYSYVCCIGYDTEFVDETLLEDFINEMESEKYDFGRGQKMSFNFWAMSVNTFPEIIGYFDENFMPAYWEDIDMMRRIRLYRDKGLVKTLKYMKDRDRIIHHQSRTVNDHNNLIPKDVWDDTFSRNQLYLRGKWGTDKDDHTTGFKHPFNNPKFHISFWVPNRERIEKHRKLWDECIKKNG